jgi:putative NADH-flavin reductase
MKILVLGATGLTGEHLVKQGLDRGHSVTAFVRDPSKIRLRHPNLRVFAGDVSNAEHVREAIKGHDAVLSALGAKSPFKRDYRLITGINNVVTAMEQENVKRLVYQSFLGVKENREDLGFFVNHVVSFLLQKVIADHEEKERIIKKSKLQWTIIRPPKLTNGSGRGKYRTGEHITSSSLILKVSRPDVADFMLHNWIPTNLFARFRGYCIRSFSFNGQATSDCC